MRIDALQNNNRNKKEAPCLAHWAHAYRRHGAGIRAACLRREPCGRQGVRVAGKTCAGFNFRRLCAALMPALIAFAGNAATLYVALDGNNSSGSSWAAAYTSLYAAVNASASGDIILIKQGHYCNTNSAAIFAKSLTISGGYFGEIPLPGNFTNDPAATILDACRTNHVLRMEECVTGMIERLTFYNGYKPYGAGIFATNSNVTFKDCDIDGNTVPSVNGGGGAGLYMRNGRVNLLRCKFRNNTALGSTYGAAIYQLAGDLRVEHCEIIGNEATRDGAALYSDNAAANTRIFNTIIANNYAKRYGVVHVNNGNLSMLNCTVFGNTPASVHRVNGELSATTAFSGTTMPISTEQLQWPIPAFRIRT